METGYGIISIQDQNQDPPLRDVTEALGCTDTRVRIGILEGGDDLTLSARNEHVVIPLSRDGTIIIDDEDDVVFGSMALTRDEGEIASDGTSSVVIVSAPRRNGVNDPPETVELAQSGFVVPSTSDIATSYLTETLGCTGMKVNARLLHPGQHVPYHTEGTQEELFIPLSGPASMIIDDEEINTPVETVIRVPPETPRSAVNDGDTDALWVMIGAPPTGDTTGWDPGAKILE